MEIRVAIFEDNRMLLESLQRLIDDADDMICAGAFSDANRLSRDMQSSDPNVVLMDIDMPGISGIEATQSIRERFPQVKILILTVFEDTTKYLPRFAQVHRGTS